MILLNTKVSKSPFSISLKKVIYKNIGSTWVRKGQSRNHMVKHFGNMAAKCQNFYLLETIR
jgi:hypothetical protein